MTALLKKSVAVIVYVGNKDEKPDTTAAATGLVWYGKGFTHLVDEEAALKLMAHPDVWQPIATEDYPVPPRVAAAFRASYRKFYKRDVDERFNLPPELAPKSFLPLNPSVRQSAETGLISGVNVQQPSQPVSTNSDGEGDGSEDDDLNFDSEDFGGTPPAPTDSESPRVGAIREAIVSLDPLKHELRNPDFFNKDGTPKLSKIKELMGCDDVTREEVAAVFTAYKEEMSPTGLGSSV